ncbi:unnamed protein product [Didymodactylos carnosus]|uniref:Uncharacterized protein n=1 Tax=Didymodactylos carnosus TaxID=1234261 RepID=A0A816CLP7_9BILA|nr:unnamed protein product [Didymodactylos carnosus]CAF1623711.1 unnamed protein product [Didymodactylos carnosus]CAF3832554.1 unnamed protein product [Didymodactylos carnosus]CAF4515922.1 unnamed protein product [Didymodactylos carnosus]
MVVKGLRLFGETNGVVEQDEQGRNYVLNNDDIRILTQILYRYPDELLAVLLVVLIKELVVILLHVPLEIIVAV